VVHGGHVDRRGRSRSRVLHPCWERTAEGLVGWITTRPTPLGHDPCVIWPDGPTAPDAGVLRLRPWRLRVANLDALFGREPVLTRAAGSPGM
jgi:hypothetical protein